MKTSGFQAFREGPRGRADGEIFWIIKKFIESRGSFSDIVEFPPVAFKQNFLKGSNIVGEKAYEFADKKGRQLILTPDPQVHTFDNHIASRGRGRGRYSWISPAFRYRHAPTRHFYQIGYTSINFKLSNEADEIILGLETLSNFVANVCKEKVTVLLVHPSLALKITELRGDGSQIVGSYIYGQIDENHVRSCWETDELNFAQTITELNTLKNVVTYFSEHGTVNCQLDLKKTYSQETLSGTGFIIEVLGKKIGDGGIYSEYGSRYDERIQSVMSICTGVNPFLRILNLL